MMTASDGNLHLGGHELELRAPTSADLQAILTFARALPADDLVLLATDITEEDTVRAWVADSESGASVAMVACADGKVAGCFSIVRNNVPWMHHVGDLQLVVAEPMRRIGLGRALTAAAIEAGLSAGIEKLVATMALEQDAARQMFEQLGFQLEAVLRYQVRDRADALHDVLMMAHYSDSLLAGYRSTISDHRSMHLPSTEQTS